MRHRKKINHLGRTSSHRKALLANMAISLIEHKRIRTTVAKAKALKKYVEPLITKSKEDSTHSRRVVFSYLNNKYAVSELFREISTKVANRPGGYTRILKTGTRFGDNAEMCIIELVDYNENMISNIDSKQKSTRRSRRGTKKTTETTQEVVSNQEKQSEVSTEKVVEETSPEVVETIAPETDESKTEGESDENKEK